MLHQARLLREVARQELRGLPAMPATVTSSKEARLIERKIYIEGLIRDLTHFIESWEYNLDDERNGVENMR